MPLHACGAWRWICVCSSSAVPACRLSSRTLPTPYVVSTPPWPLGHAGVKGSPNGCRDERYDAVQTGCLEPLARVAHSALVLLSPPGIPGTRHCGAGHLRWCFGRARRSHGCTPARSLEWWGGASQPHSGFAPHGLSAESLGWSECWSHASGLARWEPVRGVSVALPGWPRRAGPTLRNHGASQRVVTRSRRQRWISCHSVIRSAYGYRGGRIYDHSWCWSLCGIFCGLFIYYEPLGGTQNSG